MTVVVTRDNNNEDLAGAMGKSVVSAIQSKDITLTPYTFM